MPASVAASPREGAGFRLEQGLRRPRTGAARFAPGFPWLHLSVGCGVVLTALFLLAEGPPPGTAHPSEPPVRGLGAAPPLPVWTPVPRPLPIYGLDAPVPKPLPFAFSARRNGAGAREDTLAFGAFQDAGEAYLRLVLHRSPEAEDGEASFFLDIARRAAFAGLAVVRSAPPQGLDTKFGPAEVAEVTLAEGAARVCLAFRFARQDVGFRAAGWLCAADGQALERTALACAIDRLALVEAGNDEALKGVFAEADRRRMPGCAPPAVPAVTSQAAAEGAKGRPRRSHARPAPAPSTGARKGSANHPRATARGTGSSSPNSRG